jgi:hypothetical protein
VFHDRQKYIEIKHYILDKIRREKWFQYISTDGQIADILVKPLSKMKSLQVGARGDDFLIEKGRDYSQVGREH